VLLDLRTEQTSLRAQAGCDAPSDSHSCTTAKITLVYVSFTRVSTADQPIENAAIVAEEMLRWLREIDGFDGFLMLSREGTSVGLTFWESREVAEHHRVARMQFLQRMTSVAAVEIEETTDFEVSFAELGPRLTGFSA
jgi:hypothetical protein